MDETKYSQALDFMSIGLDEMAADEYDSAQEFFQDAYRLFEEATDE